MKDRLIFDTTDANTIADSDSIGAFVRGSDGTLITQTGGALDVNIGTVSDLDIRDLTDGSGNSGFDQVRIGDGTDTLAVNADGSLNITDNGGSLTVDAVDFDIRDLSASQDNVAISDGTDTLAVNADGSINVVSNDSALANTAIASTNNALDVANTAEDVVASPLASRKYLFIYNSGNRTAYIGASGVSATNGFPLSPGSTMELRAGASVDIEWVSANVSQELRTLELS